MWHSGDQDKPMPTILLASDSALLKSDTIAIYKYFITGKEFLDIRNYFLNQSLLTDSSFISIKSSMIPEVIWFSSQRVSTC